MFIKRLEVENWKCFEKKKVFNFDKHMLLSYGNGFGKTSIMQAIEFAVFGKAPAGFNFNTVRNSEEKPCTVSLYFTINTNDGIESEANIIRSFGNNNASANISELRIDNQLVCESVRTIYDYMDKLLNQKITSQLWTSSLITSDIISNNFFTKNILDDILAEPIELQKEYTSRIYRKNREINSFKEVVLDIDKIKDELDKIKSKLKENPNNSSITLARSAKNADEKIKELQKKIRDIIDSDNDNNKIPSLEDCRKFTRLYSTLSRMKNNLEEEKKKEDNIFSKFSKREIEKIIAVSEELNTCIICGSNFTKEHKEKTIQQLNNCGRSEARIKELEENITFVESMNKTIVDAILEIESQKIIVNKCKNYQEIIDSYDENNNKLWEEFQKVQKDLAIAMKQQEQLKHINELKAEVENDREKLNFVKDYIEKSSIYHTNQLLSKASSYLSSINTRYKQICLYENSFYVVVENAETFALDLLPVARLSNGEKTMCALSLIFAMHNIITPQLPLIFDESFSALDSDNLNQVKRFLRRQSQTQIFVITHDTTWVEF